MSKTVATWSELRDDKTLGVIRIERIEAVVENIDHDFNVLLKSGSCVVVPKWVGFALAIAMEGLAHVAREEHFEAELIEVDDEDRPDMLTIRKRPDAS